ncbi:GrpB family protein [Marisediminicola senii]|uniref:GrpB family protein n=1 Tax=Marisediminicola senii TaxID=2711233 RepID=UPI0013EB0AD2|nr:GrpB family protein [Marisediminicola senii]
MVTVQPYSPDWRLRFEREAATLEIALADSVTAIEHVGSTAIPDLAAKPVIDLAACAIAGIDPFALQPSIASLGYSVYTSGPKTHAVYTKSNDTGRTAILHVFTPESWPTCNQRVLRDKLLHDESARERYGQLKLDLAASGLAGMDYTAAKLELLQELLDEERTSRGLSLITAWEK